MHCLPLGLVGELWQNGGSMDMEAAYARWQNGGPLRPTPSGAEEATTLMGGHAGEYTACVRGLVF